jgi:hypothetical protein
MNIGSKTLNSGNKIVVNKAAVYSGRLRCKSKSESAKIDSAQ